MNSTSFPFNKAVADQILSAITHYLYNDIPPEDIKSVIIDRYNIDEEDYRELFSEAYIGLTETPL